MNRLTFRLLPLALALAAVVLAALAPALRARAFAPATSPMSASVVGCNVGAVAGTDSVYLLPPLCGVLQPFQYTVPFASCTLAISPVQQTYSELAIRVWDPLALAPDPTTVALRTRSYNVSDLVYNHVRADFSPPIVVEPGFGVAEPTRTTLAVDYRSTFDYFTQYLRYWSDGPADIPVARRYQGAVSGPINGPHPVLGVSFCPAEGQADLRVLQAVSGTTTLLGFAAYEYLQRFRVPSPCTLDWIETAFGYNLNATPFVTGLVGILDGGTMPEPVASLPATIFQADFYAPMISTSTWATHFQTAAPAALEPGRDYWLLVRSANKYPLWARDLTGGEPQEFEDGIGPLFSRTTPAGQWSAMPNRALSFRLIGVPQSPSTSVGPPPRTSLRVGVEPNPARGAALVRWSGARGAVRFEVLDPRGRRVAMHEAAGPDGSWLWRGARDGGESVAPGVYFVRVLDDAGARGSARVVLIR